RDEQVPAVGRTAGTYRGAVGGRHRGAGGRLTRRPRTARPRIPTAPMANRTAPGGAGTGLTLPAGVTRSTRLTSSWAAQGLLRNPGGWAAERTFPMVRVSLPH